MRNYARWRTHSRRSETRPVLGAATLPGLVQMRHPLRRERVHRKPFVRRKLLAAVGQFEAKAELGAGDDGGRAGLLGHRRQSEWHTELEGGGGEREGATIEAAALVATPRKASRVS